MNYRHIPVKYFSISHMWNNLSESLTIYVFQRHHNCKRTYMYTPIKFFEFQNFSNHEQKKEAKTHSCTMCIRKFMPCLATCGIVFDIRKSGLVIYIVFVVAYFFIYNWKVWLIVLFIVYIFHFFQNKNSWHKKYYISALPCLQHE